MRIIILRHAKRYGSPLFETSLTEEGIQRATKLIELLREYEIDEIYASPFLRVMQTIYPYCYAMNKKVCVENSFYECLKSDEFTYHNYRHNVSELFEEHPEFRNIIEKYKSYMNVANVSYVETDIDIQNRVYRFMWKLKKKYGNTNKTILIATHMTICNTIKKYFDKSITLRDEFPQGSFEIIEVPKETTSRDCI